MNLVDGRIFEAAACDAVLDNLENRIISTLSQPRLDPELVITACDKLMSGLDESYYLELIQTLGIDVTLGRKYLSEARLIFSGESLRHRLRIELGDGFSKPRTFVPPGRAAAVTEQLYPLGVLVHIAAGNADGLPAFSVLEGLLTGNINILKLPAEEGGISVRLLQELIRIEPSLAEYIYVFDYSSKDILHIRKLVNVADAVVVWGGVEAISALRGMLPPNVRLIEWGHKISFGYVTPQGLGENGLRGLAVNISETGQLLCSSIQGIYLDTEDITAVYDFCDVFLPILSEALGRSGSILNIGLRSQTGLRLYTEELNSLFSGNKVYRGQGCSLIACGDKVLDTSIQFGNPWVKRLPRQELIRQLHPYKNFLQTVGLVCAEEERDALSDLLFKAGAVRVCPGAHMSSAYSGDAHDGEYPLRRYVKIVSME